MQYLASPYTAHPGGPERAWLDACHITTELMRDGRHVISPIVETYPLVICEPNDNYDGWLSYGLDLLGRCDGLIVAMLKGWEQSYGIGAEIEHARKLGLPVTYHDPAR